MTEPRQELTEYQKAAAVARYVEVVDVSMTSLNAALLTPAKFAVEATEVGISSDKSCSFRFDEQTRGLVVTIKFDCVLKGKFVEGTDQQKFADKPIAAVSCVFAVDYSFGAKNGPPPEDRDAYFQAFANVNGVFNTWPYLRELVHSSISRMGLPPILLPVYRVPSSKPKPAEAAEPGKADAAGAR